MSVVKRWRKLPRYIVVSPYLKIDKACLHMFRGKQLLVALLEQGNWSR